MNGSAEGPNQSVNLIWTFFEFWDKAVISAGLKGKIDRASKF